MLDNNLKNLSNKGWSAMESILDQEMPTTKKSRKWVFFLLFSFLGLGAVGVYYYNWHLRDVTDVVDSSKEFGSVVTDLEIHNGNRTISDAQVQNDSIRNLNEATYENPHEQQGSMTKVPYRNSELTSNVSLKVKQTIGASILDENELEEFQSNDHSVNLGFQKNDENQVEIVSQPFSGSRNASRYFEMDLLEKIDVLNFQILNHNDNHNLPELVKVSQKTSNYLRFYSGYALPLSSNLRGPELGIGIGKNINPRWSVELGARIFMSHKNYSFLTINNNDFALENQFDPNEMLDWSGQYDSDLLGENKIKSEYFDLIAEKISHLYLLNVPLSVNYKILNKHELSLGIQYQYLISATNDDIQLSEIVSSLSNQNISLGNNVLIENSFLERHNWGIKGQYRFMLNQHVGINMSANLGLRKILKTDVMQDSRNRMSYISLGLDYKL